MKALRYDPVSAALSLDAQAAQPVAGPGEVLVRVHAAGVTPTELVWYPTAHTKSGAPRTRCIPGHEFSGVIAAGVLKNGLTFPRLGLHLEFTVFGAILAALVMGTLLGCVNGAVITRLGVPPFVTTLPALANPADRFTTTTDFPITWRVWTR